MREWKTGTWLLGLLAFLPGLCALVGFAAFGKSIAGSVCLLLGLVFWLVAFLVFGRRVLRDYRSAGGGAEVGSLVGYGIALLAGPAASALFAEAAPGGLGWLVTLAAFPVYWYRAVKPARIA